MLSDFAKCNGLYLDKAGARRARKGKKRPSWIDLNGNKHDLDFVLERNGSAEKVGIPVAFIETAWRRYSKHSKNKAQEIQGALVPLAETYRHLGPFKGVVLAGVFTEGALQQLRSLGFLVVHLSYVEVVNSFAQVGIDVATAEETSVEELQAKVAALQGLTVEQSRIVSDKLTNAGGNQFKVFMETLKDAVGRSVLTVRILSLYGYHSEFNSVVEAVAFLTTLQSESISTERIAKFEIEVAFSNGAHVRGEFPDQGAAINFLNAHAILPVAL